MDRRNAVVGTQRSALSRMRRGEHPDVPLSTVTEMAAALGVDPIAVLNFERNRQFAEVADDARAAAAARKKNRAK